LVTAYANDAEVEDKISYIASTGRVYPSAHPAARTSCSTHSQTWRGRVI
jgi:hypothetical protein